MNQEIEKQNIKAARYSGLLRSVIDETKNVIVGQDDILEKLIISLIANGHVLLEGVPGLAKTLMIKTLSDTISAGFARIQFTPDLLPADITGTKIYDHKSSSFSTRKGPIFTNFILADEINRAPPKVQSALLEAMQERQVSISGETYPLQKPFLVLATQNPIETEGTYRLPEAQVDRFMFKLVIGYPSIREEKAIIKRNTGGIIPSVKKILSPSDIQKVQEFTPRIYADEKIEDYVSEIVHATRRPKDFGLDISDQIEYGASPRASIWLVLAAKGNALLNSRGYVIPEDVKAIAHEVLRHRIILTYTAEAEGVSTDDIVSRILNAIRSP